MADNQQQRGPASFGKIKAFENGGYVIQFAFDLNDLLKFGVRNNKVYFKLTELKQETKYGQKYLITEDEYMANYQNGREGSITELLLGKQAAAQQESMETDKPYTPGEITANAWKPVGPQANTTGPAPVGPMAQNVDDLFA